MENRIFKDNYQKYLQELASIDFAEKQDILGIDVRKDPKWAKILFFQTTYQVSKDGILDPNGEVPHYGICVVLCKYLLMAPAQIPAGADWVNYRDLKNTGTTHSAALADYAQEKIVKRFAGKLHRLEQAVNALGGRPPETDYPYDIAAIIQVLPRLPILFLFNDADEQFPAQASILFERRAEHFLDAECLVMVKGFLYDHLKKEQNHAKTE